jgi:hypothetical protein
MIFNRKRNRNKKMLTYMKQKKFIMIKYIDRVQMMINMIIIMEIMEISLIENYLIMIS